MEYTRWHARSVISRRAHHMISTLIDVNGTCGKTNLYAMQDCWAAHLELDHFNGNGQWTHVGQINTLNSRHQRNQMPDEGSFVSVFILYFEYEFTKCHCEFLNEEI